MRSATSPGWDECTGIEKKDWECGKKKEKKENLGDMILNGGAQDTGKLGSHTIVLLNLQTNAHYRELRGHTNTGIAITIPKGRLKWNWRRGRGRKCRGCKTQNTTTDFGKKETK